MATGDAVTFVPTATQAAIPCCLCGTVILPNPANMCANCIRSQVDIAEGIQKQVTIVYCKACGRYLVPPKQWIRAELESKELLTFCVKRIKGLQKVKLVDASFIWTEPHSKRIKVKLTIQGEAYSGVMLQQTLVVDFQVEWNMCVDCNRANTNVSAWKSVAQVRQHVSHKRTFMFLEQLIVKHGAHEQCLNIKECHQGLDFYFGNRSHAQKFVDFLQNVVPAKFRHDKQLVSHDTHSASYNYRYTFSVEIAPICKDDLICLPPKLSQKHGQIGPLLLCTKISNAITLMCPYSLQVTHIDVKQFYNNPFTCIAGSRQLTRYIVLDIEPLEPEAGRHKLAEAQVARESDFGKNNTVFMCRTHLGRFLQPGDVALGYDLARFVNTDDNLEAAIRSGYQAPDVVLVKKCFDEVRAKRRAQQRPRNYKLRQLEKEMEDANNAHAKRAEAAEAQRQEDLEQFMNELEEDPELRQQVSLYKNEEALAYQPPKNAFAPQAAPEGADNAMMEGASDAEEDVDAAALDIPLDELLDDLEGLNMEDED